jgi:hypothetical protein
MLLAVFQYSWLLATMHIHARQRRAVGGAWQGCCVPADVED